MSKNRLVSSNNAITILENGNPRALTPRLNFEGDIAVVTNDNGQATVKFEVPKNQISEDLLDDLVNLKLTNYIPCCVNSGTVDENGYADFLKQVATQSEFIWNQPVLTEDGDITVNEFVVASPTEVADKEIYKMFDGSTSTVGCFQENANITDSYFDMYFKDPLKISALQITLPTDEYVTSIKVQASVDGINYTDLATFSALSTVAANICNLSSNLRFFHYYRVVGLSANGSYSIAEMKIVGTCLKTIASTGFNPNYNISGTSITVNDEGIASGFASDSVLTTNRNISFGSNTWEFKTKFRLTANNADSRLMGSAGGSLPYSPILGIVNNKFAIWLSSNGTSWDLADANQNPQGTVTLQNNTDYYVKFGWNKTQYYVQYSIDDVSYITDWTLASTTLVYEIYTLIPLGSNISTNYPLIGTIDLKETYIKVNDKIVWDCTSTETLIEFSDNFTRNSTYATNRNSIIGDGNGWQAYSSNAQAGIGIANNQLQIYTDNNLASAMYRRSLEDYQNYNSLILEANYQLLSARAVGNQQTSFALGIDNVLAPAYSTADVNYVFGSGLEVVVSPGTQSVYLYNNGEVLDTATVEILVNSVYKLKVEVTPAKIEVRFWLSTLGEPIDATISSNTGWSTAGKYFAIAQNNSATVAFDTSITNLSIAITKMIGLDNTQSWIQPILTSDLSEGLVEATSYKENCNPYKALDGIKSGTTDQSNCFVFDNATTGFWKWTLPYTVTITGINFYNIYSPTSGEKIIEGQFFADEEMTIPIGNSFLTSDNDWAMTQIQNIASEGVTTHTIYFNKTGGSAYSGIGELEIFGTINSQNQVFFDTSSNLVLTNANNETVELPFIDSVPVHQHTYLPLIPSMTSYNTPAGTVTGVGGELNTSYSYWKAFLGNSDSSSQGSNHWASLATSTLGGPKYTFASPMEPGTYRFKFDGDPYDPTDGQIKSCTIVGIKSDDTEVELWAQLNIQNVATLQTFISPEIEVTEEFATIYFRAEGKWSSYLCLCNCQVYKKDPTGTVAFDNDKIVNIAVNTTTGKAQSVDDLYIQPTKPVLNGYKYNFYNNGATITSDNVLITTSNTRQCIMADKTFDPGDSPWEIKMHFKTPSQWTSTGGDLLGMSQVENCKVPNLAWNSDHDFVLNLSSNGTGLDIASEVTGTYTYQLDTEYWMKLEFTGTNYIVSYSFNDNDYVNDVTVASTTPIFVDGHNTIAIGNNLYNSSSSESFGGEIYLEDCYFKVGDEIVWRPVTQTTAENNQVYWMDTSVYPYNTYIVNNGEFELANDLVWVGQAILENGQIKEIKSNPFNFNCTDRKMIECWSKDTSWYKIFLEFDQGVKQIRRWCEQGGLIFSASTTAVMSLLKPFKDSNYSIFTSLESSQPTTYGIGCYYNAPTQFTYTTIGQVATGYKWKAEGYMD